MQLDTFGDAIESAQDAFFQNDRHSFATAVERARTAVPIGSPAASSLCDAEKIFPSPDALKMVMKAVSEVLELHRKEVQQRVLEERPCWPYAGTLETVAVLNALPTY